MRFISQAIEVLGAIFWACMFLIPFLAGVGFILYSFTFVSQQAYAQSAVQVTQIYSQANYFVVLAIAAFLVSGFLYFSRFVHANPKVVYQAVPPVPQPYLYPQAPTAGYAPQYTQRPQQPVQPEAINKTAKLQEAMSLARSGKREAAKVLVQDLL